MLFLTGGSGYLGSYVLDHLLRHSDERLVLLVRAHDEAQARAKLWRTAQLHTPYAAFRAALANRIELVRGDLTAPQLGLSAADWQRLAGQLTSVVHVAASLNRRSSKACFNHNLRGTLAVLQLARAALVAAPTQGGHGLRRFSYVSTVAVAGHRSHETVLEDTAIDWQRSDYDPYAQTKKFAEHMVHELLPEVAKTIFRPSIVMGDSQRPETTQFDMVRAFCLLADLPLLPLHPETRLDIVPANYVGRAIASLHLKKTQHTTYHLSAGEAAPRAQAVSQAVARALGRRPPRFVPAMQPGFGSLVHAVAQSRQRNAVVHAATLLKVFWPYITFDTVFDNQRVVRELGEAPASFLGYCAPLYRFAKQTGFAYPYLPEPTA